MRADVDRRLEADPSRLVPSNDVPNVRNTGPFRLLAHIRAAHETVGERRAVRPERDRGDHAVAVEPVAILEITAREARRAVEIAGAAQERRQGAVRIRRGGGLFDDVEREGALEQRRVISHTAETTALRGVMKRHAASGFHFQRYSSLQAACSA
jgi:hypothetical protein